MRGQRGREQRGVLGLLRKALKRRQPRPIGGGSSVPSPRVRASDGADVDPLILDVEADARPQRHLAPNGVHGMFSSDDGGDDDADDAVAANYSKEDLERLLSEREHQQFADLEHKKDFAKTVILRRSHNPQELMRLAENFIDEDWLGKSDEMQGNIYRIGAFGGLAVDSLQNMARFLGALAIWFVQFFGPPAVFANSMGYGIEKDKAYNWDEWTNWEDPEDKAKWLLSDWYSFPAPKAMATIFIFLFTLNGLFVLIDEKHCFAQMDSLLRYLDRNTRKFTWSGENLLYLDAFMNNWLVFWCSLDSYILVGNSRTVKDVLFDSLSLLFLYNLDDISGDLGFVNNDDWDGLRLGWIYDSMVVPKFNPEGPRPPTGYYDDNGDWVDDDEFEPSLIFMLFYDITIGILAVASFALPILNIVTPFMHIGFDD